LRNQHRWIRSALVPLLLVAGLSCGGDPEGAPLQPGAAGGKNRSPGDPPSAAADPSSPSAGETGSAAPIKVGTASGELLDGAVEPALSVVATPESSTVVLGATALVKVDVRNTGSEALQCARAVHDLLSVYLEINHGNARAEYIRIRKEYFAPILDKTKSCEPLPRLALAPGEATSAILRFVLPEPGEYRLRAVYRGFGPSNLLFFRSEWASITVEPAGEARSLHALVHTDLGDMEFAFQPEEALATCIHFLTLVAMRFYDNTLIHRVEKDFVLQAGDLTGTGLGGPGFFIPQEFSRRPHLEGALSMVRRHAHVDTAGSQFFICFRMDQQNQKLLDGQYTVFGRVARGFETALKIGEVRVDSKKQPIEPIRITQIALVTR